MSTSEKGKLIDLGLKKLIREQKITSVLVVGCNLGAYTYLCHLTYGINQCYGVDYNRQYINTNIKVRDHLNLKGINFLEGKLSDINFKSDLVIFVGLIHHLFQRTDDYGSIEAILKDIYRVTAKFAIIEFPDELDPKAGKWTNLREPAAHFGRYDRATFEEDAKRNFDDCELLGSVAKTRHMYLVKI